MTQADHHRALLGSGIDADWVGPKLWIGARPPTGRAVYRAGFRELWLCAWEIQPPATDFPGVAVRRVPLDDTHAPSASMMREAVSAGFSVARSVSAGRRVLVTCALGRNRSGLVTALACHALTGWPGERCVLAVQQARPFALGNGAFVRFLSSL